MELLESTLQALGANILEFMSWIIIGGVFIFVALCVIACCVAFRDDD